MNPSFPHVVCAADNRYVIPLSVMLCSMAKNLRDESVVTVWILDGGITPSNKRKIDASLPAAKLELHWMPVDASLLAHMPVFGHISLSTYYRFLIGEILPREVEKVIYLDVDVIVLGDVVDLWEAPLGPVALLAVNAGQRKKIEMMDPAILAGNGLNGEGGYFNAGVMVINLDLWRAGNLLERAGAFVGAYGNVIRYWDQDILNCLLNDQWGRLDEKWNRIVDHADVMTSADLLAYQAEGGLMHFASAIKPWTWWANHPAKELYFRWVDQTAWKGWRPRAPLRCTIGNKHWWGACIRRIPIVGHAWEVVMAMGKRS